MNRLYLTISVVLIFIHAQPETLLTKEQQTIEKLEIEIETLHPLFLEHFVSFYHLDLEQSTATNVLDLHRIRMKKGTYFMLLAKMYLYKLLPNNDIHELKVYDTKSQYAATYYYLKLAAQKFQNPEAYFLLGVLEQFKLVPDKVLESNLIKSNISGNHQQKLMKYLEQSHLYNVESSLYMSSALGFDPASIALGFLNKNRLGTSKNCTASLAYYLSVIKNTYVESFIFRQVYTFADSFEDQLYNKKRLTYLTGMKGHFIEDTDYFDEQTISATSELADNYYMGRGGYIRNATKAAHLYEKLAQGGSSYGKVMAGICYFKGEGVPINRPKAKAYFQQNPKDQLCEYMLIAMKYFEMLEPGTKPEALRVMLQKYKLFKKQKQKISSHLVYLIGASIVKGQLKDKQVTNDKIFVIAEAEGISMIDHAANMGLPMAKVLLGILFADGTNGLKYGCQEAVKFFYEDSLTFPYFKNRVSTANAAVNRGQIAFGLIKYMQLTLIGYETAYINILYIIQVYKNEFLRFNEHSWSLKDFSSNRIYQEVKSYGFVSIQSLFLKQYRIKQSPTIFNHNNIESYLKVDESVIQQVLTYIRKKTIKWGSISQKKNILKYYEYLLAVEENLNPINFLTSLASGDSSKPYVSQARYLLGKYQHQTALGKNSSLTPQQHFKIINQYRRAVKSEILGNLIFSIQDYLIRNQFQFSFFQSDIGQDLLIYIFIVSILIFVLYYLRSIRLDKFHKTQLQKQLKKVEQEEHQKQKLSQENKKDGKAEKQQQQRDPNQPIIIEDEQQPRGIRIGSSYDENN